MRGPGAAKPCSSGKSFYRPAVGTGLIDTNFSLNNGAFDIHTHDSGLSGFINTTLGERGWTLPYDRTTLCAAVTCNGDGPSSQFFSAGVSTVAPPGHPTWRQLVPTFAFKGTVAPLATWGTLTWNVPNLALQFVQGAKLDVNSTLNASGTLLTAANATSGWGGIRVTGAAHTSFDGITIEKVSAASGAGAALTYLDSEPDIGDSIIRDAIGSGVDGIYLGGAAQVGTIENVFVQNVTGDGIGLSGEFDYLRFIGNTVVNNSGHGFSFGYRSGGFLGNNLSAEQRRPRPLRLRRLRLSRRRVQRLERGQPTAQQHHGWGLLPRGRRRPRGHEQPLQEELPRGERAARRAVVRHRRATPRKAPTPGRATRGPWPTSSATGGGGPANPDTTSCAAIPVRRELHRDPLRGPHARHRLAAGSSFAEERLDRLRRRQRRRRGAPHVVLAHHGRGPPRRGGRARTVACAALLARGGGSVDGGRRAAGARRVAGGRGGVFGRALQGAVAVSETAAASSPSTRSGGGEDVSAERARRAGGGGRRRARRTGRGRSPCWRRRGPRSGDRAGALASRNDVLAAERDPAASLEGHVARFHLLLASARQRPSGYAEAARRAPGAGAGRAGERGGRVGAARADDRGRD